MHAERPKETYLRGETLAETDEPGGVAAVHAVMKAPIATEMRCFVVTGTPRTLFLEWLT